MNGIIEQERPRVLEIGRSWAHVKKIGLDPKLVLARHLSQSGLSITLDEYQTTGFGVFSKGDWMVGIHASPEAYSVLDSARTMNEFRALEMGWGALTGETVSSFGDFDVMDISHHALERADKSGWDKITKRRVKAWILERHAIFEEGRIYKKNLLVQEGVISEDAANFWVIRSSASHARRDRATVRGLLRGLQGLSPEDLKVLVVEIAVKALSQVQQKSL
ncbi:hypothetical protein A2870_01615 [Candidatus Curtissbacteria bacterium RIFCSPHIGHO2_01_FULL_41_11]|uniref:Uncharacterized protein n=1 Tax=Candidatus Curtissbacteria bacterium RIFCSPHIGHO2_01_FULL_41_11 TaxID=1797711 RepID=A0A1F5G4Q9_9BACT|nr:MAG: hypothetical protein A2870_01615 [Candidatus Curtissbacteria bacterium RIFCSPHIGHO2_01_FULL_41_11]